MISTYLTDEIILINCSVDSNGVKTETELSEEKARVFDYNRMIFGQDGKEILAEAKVLLEKTSTVKYGWKMKIKKRFGNTYELPDKKFVIKKIVHAGSFADGFIKVYL